MAFVFCDHTRSFFAIAKNAGDFLSSHHIATITSQSVGQRMCNSIASARYSEGTLIVKVGNKGVSGKGSLTFFGSVERQISHENIAKYWVGNDRIDDVVDTPYLVLGIDGSIAVGLSQGVER